MKLNIADTFNKELPADSNKENFSRQVENACFSYVTPKHTESPKMIHVSKYVANLLGIKESDIQGVSFLKIFTGNQVYSNTYPYAMNYGGHQFGNWAGQLGDGRAINLFEIENDNNRLAVQLKGAGATPYSRSADGLAVLRSSIREYLCSEAMFHLGVPTTRALSLAITGDKVLRDVMYNGNSAYEKGAVVCRVAPTFIRFGNFQILAAKQDIENLKILTNYTLKYYFPKIDSTNLKSATIELFKSVSKKTLNMIVEWQRIGFVHGVMNTDNMSILGQTIDYGPYGWLEGYDFNWTPNTTDAQHKRYRFGNQPNIGLWNLLQLANALYPIVEESEPFQEVLENYKSEYDIRYLEMMKSKLGLKGVVDGDKKLIEQLEEILHLTEVDMTIFFRNLNSISQSTEFNSNESVHSFGLLKDAFYKPEEVVGDVFNSFKDWLDLYVNRLCKETVSIEEKVLFMNSVNPKYVLRNYMAQLAIDDADKGDYKLIDELFQLLKNPYNEQLENEKWFVKRPDWARDNVGCSMLSCSS
jgi:uncharacterized protein YdiU (UPF0061 family)